MGVTAGRVRLRLPVKRVTSKNSEGPWKLTRELLQRTLIVFMVKR